MYYFICRVEVLAGEWRSPVGHRHGLHSQYLARKLGEARQSHGHRSGWMTWFGKLLLSICRKQMGKEILLQVTVE